MARARGAQVDPVLGGGADDPGLGQQSDLVAPVVQNVAHERPRHGAAVLVQ